VKIVNIEELNERLEKHLNNYNADINALGFGDEHNSTSVTRGEVHATAKQTYYLLDSFRKDIIEHLKES
jgi:hypothetical protein